jgi:tetratricopeptide (TPR) repeat protein
MKLLVLNITILLFAISGFSNTNQQLADSAEVYFKAKQYEKSIEAYEKIVASKEESAALFYNLGNAYYKVKNLPLAIANYERAKALSPNDEDIAFNLRMAKSQTVDKIKSIPVFFLSEWRNALTGVFTTNIWAYISVFAFLASLTLLLFYLFSRSIRLKKVTFWSASFLLLMSLISMASSYNEKSINFDKSFAIITNPSVNIKSSPDENSTSLFILHSGTKLQVLDQIQDWYKVKIEDGNTGWIKLEDVEKV